MKAEVESTPDWKQAFLINFALTVSGREGIWKEGMGLTERQLY